TAVDDLYLGGSTFYRWDHVLPWLVPLAWWTGFPLLGVWVMLCLISLLRRQWDAERLTYPIAEVPIQVIGAPGQLFRRPLLWVGSALGASGQLINLVHSLKPSFPGLPIGVQYYQI